MSFIGVYLIGFFFILMMMSTMWIISLLVKDASIVDIVWGLGFVLVMLVYFVFTDGWWPRRFIVLTLVLLWGGRLSIYLAWRNLGKGEDLRYQRWRQRYGKDWWWISYLQVFLLQGVIMWVVSAPLLAAQFHSGPRAITLFDLLGVFLWMIGFLFEAIGDFQLAQFKANPANKGKVMNRGLWRYTRHPNYFGDAMIWWGFYLVAVASPWGFLTIFSPVLMTFFLMRVSGVAMLEREMKKRPEYAEYIRHTSAFFPMPPKRNVPPPRR